MSDSPALLTVIATVAVVWLAAWVDLRTLKIPNALSVTGVAFGLLINVSDSGPPGLWQGLAGLGLGMALMLPGYLLHSTGAGDVKLMGAVGALLGPGRVLWALLFAALAAGFLAVLFGLKAWWTRGATGPFQRYSGMLRCLWVTGRLSYVRPCSGEALAEPMPLAVSIAVGATIAALWPL